MTNSCENAPDTELWPSQGPPHTPSTLGRGSAWQGAQAHSEHHEQHLGVGTLGIAGGSTLGLAPRSQ